MLKVFQWKAVLCMLVWVLVIPNTVVGGTRKAPYTLPEEDQTESENVSPYSRGGEPVNPGDTKLYHSDDDRATSEDEKPYPLEHDRIKSSDLSTREPQGEELDADDRAYDSTGEDRVVSSPKRLRPHDDDPVESPDVRRHTEAEGRLDALGNLFEGITISAPTTEEFTALYNRHKSEIHMIINQHLDLVLETADLISDSLPALQSIDKSGGRLYLDKHLYSRASRLFEEYVDLAGSELARDLRRAKKLVDSKTEEWNSNQVMIDLND